MKHPLQVMMENRRAGIRCGIPSYCTANELALDPRELAMDGIVQFMLDYEQAV